MKMQNRVYLAKRRNIFRTDEWKRFSKNKLALVGLIVVFFMVLTAIFAPIIAQNDPYVSLRDPVTNKIMKNASPAKSGTILGTDYLGRDVFSRTVFAARISLSVGLVAVSISTVVGILLGALAGYFGGIFDSVIMRIVDIVYCFPVMFLVMIIAAILKPSIWNIMIIIGITGWMGVARLVRAEFLSLKERVFTVAERALGAKDFRIIFRHILPNAMAPILVSATLGVAGAILTESALSFLGIGVQPPTPSWGNILTAGKDNIEIAWWLSLFPGLAILITVLGYNLLGEGIRDAIDPRLK
jgi:peptide/nickel transport system permease protein